MLDPKLSATEKLRTFRRNVVNVANALARAMVASNVSSLQGLLENTVDLRYNKDCLDGSTSLKVSRQIFHIDTKSFGTLESFEVTEGLGDKELATFAHLCAKGLLSEAEKALEKEARNRLSLYPEEYVLSLIKK